MLADYRRLPRTVHILCLGTLVNRAGAFVLFFLTMYLGEELGHGPAYATLGLGAFGLGSMLAVLVGGALADTLGRRRVLVGSLFGTAAMMLVTSQVTSAVPLLGCLFTLGVLMDMIRPVTAAVIGDIVPPKDRPLAFGLLYIAINLGFTVGAAVGGVVVQFSFGWLFLGDAATTALYGLLVVLAIPETRPAKADPDPAESKPRGASPVLRDGTFLTFCLATFISMCVFVQAFATLPLYMRNLEVSPTHYAWMMGINGALIFLLQLPITRLFASRDRMRTIAAGSLLIGVGFFATGHVASLVGFIAALVVWTFGEMLQSPFSQSVATDLAPEEQRGRYLGVFTLTFSIAMTIGPPAGGFVVERLGYETLWNATGVAMAANALLYLAMRRAVVARSPDVPVDLQRTQGEG